MELIKGNSYILVVEGLNQKLFYRCVINDIDDTFITFTDIKGIRFNYRKDKIISCEEVRQ